MTRQVTGKEMEIVAHAEPEEFAQPRHSQRVFAIPFVDKCHRLSVICLNTNTFRIFSFLHQRWTNIHWLGLFSRCGQEELAAEHSFYSVIKEGCPWNTPRVACAKISYILFLSLPWTVLSLNICKKETRKNVFSMGLLFMYVLLEFTHSIQADSYDLCQGTQSNAMQWIACSI